MDRGLKITGGAQIGWVQASWPLATLSASPSALSISAFLIGSYSFAPEQVVALKPHNSLAIFRKGIRVVHSSRECPATIAFWTFRNPERLLEEIRLSGFLPRGSSTAVPTHHGIPIRWSTIIVVIVVWNGLFLLDGFVPWNAPKAPGLFVLLALALLFATAMSVLRSAAIQSWVLKPGRSVGEIRSLLLFLLLVSGMLLVGFTLVALLGSRAG
jgi:hypothetical protein